MTKLEILLALYKLQLQELMTNQPEYDRFIKFAAPLYKYSFSDAVLIYAQRPDATLCAEYDVWVNKLGLLPAAEKGIPVIRNKNGSNNLLCLFDVKDVQCKHGQQLPTAWSAQDVPTDRLVLLMNGSGSLMINRLSHKLSEMLLSSRTQELPELHTRAAAAAMAQSADMLVRQRLDFDAGRERLHPPKIDRVEAFIAAHIMIFASARDELGSMKNKIDEWRKYSNEHDNERGAIETDARDTGGGDRGNTGAGAFRQNVDKIHGGEPSGAGNAPADGEQLLFNGFGDRNTGAGTETDNNGAASESYRAADRPNGAHSSGRTAERTGRGVDARPDTGAIQLELFPISQPQDELVPFGGYNISDDKYILLIHDYFFVKSLDKLRTGGILAYITSKGTMDKENPEVRRMIARRADLLGAIRLPNTAFRSIAGTEVTTDIVFLQKRSEPPEEYPDWVYLGNYDADSGIKVNQYFIDHPDMMLGRMEFGSHMYNGSGRDTTLSPSDNWEELLTGAIGNINGQYVAAEKTSSLEEASKDLPLDLSTVKRFSYQIIDGSIYYNDAVMLRYKMFDNTKSKRIKGMSAIRDATGRIISIQLQDSYSERDLKVAQDTLSSLYDRFVADYGFLNARVNQLAFQEVCGCPPTG